MGFFSIRMQHSSWKLIDWLDIFFAPLNQQEFFSWKGRLLLLKRTASFLFSPFLLLLSTLEICLRQNKFLSLLDDKSNFSQGCPCTYYFSKLFYHSSLEFTKVQWVKVFRHLQDWKFHRLLNWEENTRKGAALRRIKFSMFKSCGQQSQQSSC